MKKLLTLLITTLFTTTVFAQVAKKQNPTEFLPKGFIILERINGDLNKDGFEDCVFIIKKTDQNQIIKDEFRGQLDLNRRGIIVLFNKNGRYELAVKNYDCFSSESEYGGGYFPPELFIEINNGNLSIHYGHGRYGYWEYIFRYQNSDFELMGYDTGYPNDYVSDWITFDEESINFLSKKKLIKKVIKVTAAGKETYKETWKDVSVNGLIKLSKIKDFDELDMSIY